MAHGLKDIDWDAPWLASWRPWGEPVARRVADGESVAQALNTQRSAHSPVRFVSADVVPAEQGYESFIAQSRTCPTRDNAHDFFNGLAWLAFPRTKLRLNQLHLKHQARQSRQRGAVRDALTVFDENAALLSAPDALWQAMLAKDWASLFGPLKPLWQAAQVQLFGHALLEKLMVPRKAITAHVLRVPSGLPDLDALDAWLDAELKQKTLRTAMFAHLPVLGVPSWWPANAEPGFYADPTVFRPPRRSPKYAKNVGTSALGDHDWPAGF